MSLAWRIRGAIGPAPRRAVRRLADATLGRVVGSVAGTPPRERTVALTFDDGPDPEVTPRILDALATARVTATFFVLVERAEAHADTIRRTLDAGHEIGLHGVDHRRLTTLDGRSVRRLLADGRARLESLTGRPVRWFRPAYGAQSLKTLRAARAAGLDVVVWNAEAADWTDGPVEVKVERAMAMVRPGGVILLHDGLVLEPSRAVPPVDRAAVVAALLERMRADGWCATSVSGLCARGIRRTAWFRP